MREILWLPGHSMVRPGIAYLPGLENVRSSPLDMIIPQGSFTDSIGMEWLVSFLKPIIGETMIGILGKVGLSIAISGGC